MDKELESALKIKLAHLTCDGAKEFWDEICDDLDSQIRLSERAIRDYKLPDLEIRKAQIQLFVCERLKKLREVMVERIRKQLAEGLSGEKDDLEVANFFKPPEVA